MNCPKCGAVNPDGVSFCTACGESLTTAEPAQEQPVQTPTVTEQPPVTPPVTPPNNGWQQPPMPSWAQPPVMPTDEPVSVGKWIGIWALQAFCSIIYLVLLFVWAFGSTSSVSLKNYARAQLIVAAIVLGIVIIATIIISVCFASVIPDLINRLEHAGSYSYSYSF